jgi:hypothetical protein
MMTNAQAIQRVVDVLGKADNERELLDKALKLIAAYDAELRNSDKTICSLRAQLIAAKRANGA